MDHSEQLTGLSLCAGGGGLDHGIQLAIPGYRPIMYCEREAFAAAYLVTQMEAKVLAPAPVWTDIKSFQGDRLRGLVDILCGGYPCQPFSFAGKRGGKTDPRHLWPDFHRIIGEVEPSIVYLENVSGHLSLGFDEVSSGLEGLGYRVAAGLFSASDVDAPHERERLFILAVSNSCCTGFKRNKRGRGYVKKAKQVKESGTFGSASEFRRVRLEEKVVPSYFPPGPDGEWTPILERWPHFAPAIQNQVKPPRKTQPYFRGMADELADNRNDYLRMFGNGVVPIQAAFAFLTLWSAFWD